MASGEERAIWNLEIWKLKYVSNPRLGYGYFLELPIFTQCFDHHHHHHHLVLLVSQRCLFNFHF